MAEIPKKPQIKPWFIGWGLKVTNPELKFDWFGSPFEIKQNIEKANLDPMQVATHPATQIAASTIHKDGRVGKFKGGPNASGVMQLLDATVKKDWQAARVLLADHPQLLTAGDETASVALCLNTALGQIDVVEFLIEIGADVNATGQLGMTALHWAAVHNQPRIAECLMRSWADRSLQNWFFLTPANLAHANSHPSVLRLLTSEPLETSRAKLSEILKMLGFSGKK